MFFVGNLRAGIPGELSIHILLNDVWVSIKKDRTFAPTFLGRSKALES